MIYLFSFVISFCTIFFIALKDKNIRASKYITFLLICLISLHLFNINYQEKYGAIVILMFIIDEWLSFYPKLENINRIRKLAKLGSRFVEYKTLEKIPLKTEFLYTEHSKGIKIAQNNQTLKFFFECEKKGDFQDFYCKDFTGIYEVILGEVTVITRDAYGVEIKNKYTTGNQFEVSAFSEVKMICKSEKLKVEFTCIKPL